MLGQMRGWEWVIIAALILLLFGAKRLPDAARGLGRSLRIFKAETKGLTEDTAADAAATATPTPQPAPAAPAQPPALPAPDAPAATAAPEADAVPTERAEG